MDPKPGPLDLLKDLLLRQSLLSAAPDTDLGSDVPPKGLIGVSIGVVDDQPLPADSRHLFQGILFDIGGEVGQKANREETIDAFIPERKNLRIGSDVAEDPVIPLHLLL